jgi:hypothetical protein
VLEWTEIGANGEMRPSPVSLAVGEFARERDLVLSASHDAPELFRSEAPISSLICALCDERLLNLLLQLTGGDATPGEEKKSGVSRLRLLRKLAQRDVLRPLDDLFARSPVEKTKDKFTIPMEPGEQPGMQQLIGHLAVTFGLPAAEVLFPRDSWPWTLARETALTLSGRRNFLTQELERMYASPEAGPLSCLAVATLLKTAGMQHAELFASRGLTEIAPDDFVRDCRPLIDKGAALGKCVHQGAILLRALDEGEIEELSRSLLKDDGAILQAAARELRRRAGEPLEDAIPRALAAAWDAGLRQQVRTALESRLPDDTFRIGAGGAPPWPTLPRVSD